MNIESEKPCSRIEKFKLEKMRFIFDILSGDEKKPIRVRASKYELKPLYTLWLRKRLSVWKTIGYEMSTDSTRVQ